MTGGVCADEIMVPKTKMTTTNIRAIKTAVRRNFILIDLFIPSEGGTAYHPPPRLLLRLFWLVLSKNRRNAETLRGRNLRNLIGTLRPSPFMIFIGWDIV